MRRLSVLAVSVCFAPSLALASTTTDLVSQLAGLFYIIVGLALVISLLLMGGGLVVWVVRLGTDQNFRNQAIEMMEWGVATLFMLVVLLGIIEFVQTHTSAALYVIGIIIIALVIWIVIASGLLSGDGGEKEDHGV